MTIFALMLYVGMAAIVLTFLIFKLDKNESNIYVSYIQNFCGILFVVSGFVKIVDPLGTAYKLEEYFTEFEFAFNNTFLNFMVPMFSFLSEYGLYLSLFTILLELFIGVSLIIGWQRKLNSWLFFLIMAFFTILTGYTYLTGYVPSDSTFFQFDTWGAYKESNMKVTDCGCFGDFIKLKPFQTFIKDVLLLIPALIFLIFNQKFHVLSSTKYRNICIAIFMVIFCYIGIKASYFDEPMIDFRPFAVGKNIVKQRAIELEAIENTKILAYKITDNSTGKSIELPFGDYMKQYKNYPENQFDLQQIKEEPKVSVSKLSEFQVSNLDHEDITEELMQEKGTSVWILSYDLKMYSIEKQETIHDSVFAIEKIYDSAKDFHLEKNIKDIKDKIVTITEYQLPPQMRNNFDKLTPLVKKLNESKIPVTMIVASSTDTQIKSFENQHNWKIRYGTADEKLIKTILRSNPGIIVIKDGVVIKKIHINQYDDISQVTSVL